MKKENRKLAQEQRAAARKKKQKRDQLEKNFMITMVVAVILMFVLFIGFDIAMSDDVGNGSQQSLENNEKLSVQDGDKIHIDFVGSIDGVEFEGGNTQGQGVDLWIGSGSMIDDFEEQLIGAHPGDTVDVYVTFPDEYEKAPDLEGKEALFKVTIHGIYQ